MARTVKNIQDEIIAAVQADSVLSLLHSSTSATAIWRLWTYIVASAVYVLEVLFDTHRTTMETLLSSQHAHTLQWYTNKAKAFLYGKNLLPFSDQYDTTGMTDSDISEARIISYASVMRARRDNGRIYLLVKVAKGNTELEKLAPEELSAFRGYMNSIQDAGLDLHCISEDADLIRQEWTIYYDPQILNADGSRIDKPGTDVVRTAVRDYLKELPFNGLYVETYHVDSLQKTEGVKVPVINRTSVSSDGGQTWLTSIPEDGIEPASGWYRYNEETELVIHLKPYRNDEDF